MDQVSTTVDLLLVHVYLRVKLMWYAQTATQRTRAARDGYTAAIPPEGRVDVTVTDEVGVSFI